MQPNTTNQYRQAAQDLPDIIDWDEIDLEDYEDEDESATRKRVLEGMVRVDESDVPVNDGGHTAFDDQMFAFHHVDMDKKDDYISDLNNDEDILNYACSMDRDEESNLSNSNSQSLSNESDSLSSSSGKWKPISKKDFLSKLDRLEKQKRWIEIARRKSSMGFAQKMSDKLGHQLREKRMNLLTDKDKENELMKLLTKGIDSIRRHQANKAAEYIRLFTTNGCRTIRWEPIKVKQSENKALTTNDKSYQETGFEYCIAFCGCGDDLVEDMDLKNSNDRTSSVSDSSEQYPVRRSYNRFKP